MNENNNENGYVMPSDLSGTPVPDSVDSTVNTSVNETVDTQPVGDPTPAPTYTSDFERAGAALDEALAQPVEEAPKARNYERYLNNENNDQPQFAPGGFESGTSSQSSNTAGGGNNGYISSDFTSGSYQAPPAGNYSAAGLEEPVTMGEWLISLLLMMIPCVNIVLMFVWAFSSSEKKSKSNFFKAELIMMGVGVALYIVFFVLAMVLGFSAASMYGL
ncbi:MAG: hypothetical protein K5739_03255 [Lachnospiraceae bacterium]|nr:hypothetical protein [Lachnospiraceae bacterium]